MNVEMVWLAYDARLVERAWRNISVRELYAEILADDFRRRVDPRSMLFHKSQFYLLNDLEVLMKRGGIDLSLEEYLAKLFHKGVEEFPVESGELFVDYRIVSYYTSLRMADVYHRVEPFFAKLMEKMGAVPQGETWSMLNRKQHDLFFQALSEAQSQVIHEVASAMESDDDIAAYAKLVLNYIEFFHYGRNNGLSFFAYNNQTDIKRWGDLVERKSQRDRRVVELTYSKRDRDDNRLGSGGKTHDGEDEDLISKMRFKRRIENLEAGLQDADALIRQKAAEGLGISGNIHSVQALMRTLGDEVAEVRQEAARALGVIRDPHSVDAIIDLILRDESVAVIMSSAQALAQIGDPRGLEVLIEVLLRGVYDVAVQIAFFPNLFKQKTAVNMLLQAISHPNEVVRRQVAFILGDVPSRQAVDALLQSLDDDDLEVTTNSASSLGRIGSKRALPDLYECRKRLTPTQSRWVVEEAIDSILQRGRST